MADSPPRFVAVVRPDRFHGSSVCLCALSLSTPRPLTATATGVRGARRDFDEGKATYGQGGQAGLRQSTRHLAMYIPGLGQDLNTPARGGTRLSFGSVPCAWRRTRSPSREVRRLSGHPGSPPAGCWDRIVAQLAEAGQGRLRSPALGEQRCEECNTFMRSLGLGGLSPCCGDPITVEELFNP